MSNAGIFVAKLFTEYTDKAYANILAINLNGLFHITSAAKWMLKQGSDHIVQDHDQPRRTRCQNGAVGAGIAHEGGSSAATKPLAIDYAGKGIRVSTVAPGAIKAPMHEPEAHDFEFLAKLHQVGRIGEVRDIVDAALYLEGASFVTGKILHVDRGQSVGHQDTARNRGAFGTSRLTCNGERPRACDMLGAGLARGANVATGARRLHSGLHYGHTGRGRLLLPFAALGFSAVISMMPGFFLFQTASALVELVSMGPHAPVNLLTTIAANGATAFLIILAMTSG